MIWIIIFVGALLLGAVFALGRTTGTPEINNTPVQQLDPKWTPEKQKETKDEIENRPDQQLADDLNNMLSSRRGDTD